MGTRMEALVHLF
jgi:hypothetical protein